MRVALVTPTQSVVLGDEPYDGLRLVPRRLPITGPIIEATEWTRLSSAERETDEHIALYRRLATR